MVFATRPFRSLCKNTKKFPEMQRREEVGAQNVHNELKFDGKSMEFVHIRCFFA